MKSCSVPWRVVTWNIWIILFVQNLEIQENYITYITFTILPITGDPRTEIFHLTEQTESILHPRINGSWQWQWCWWQLYFGDFRMVANFSNVSPSETVSNICHQHWCNPQIISNVKSDQESQVRKNIPFSWNLKLKTKNS